jgi:hypothetical protein
MCRGLDYNPHEITTGRLRVVPVNQFPRRPRFPPISRRDYKQGEEQSIRTLVAPLLRTLEIKVVNKYPLIIRTLVAPLLRTLEIKVVNKYPLIIINY